MAGLHQVKPSHLDTVKCAISHPYAWERLTLGHFGPFQAPIQGPRGPKIVFFMCSNSGHYGAQSPVKGTSPGKCPVCQNTTPKCEVAVAVAVENIAFYVV